MEKITSCHLSFSCWHLVVRSRRSPLRLRTHGKQSAQQSNEICPGANDRLGLKMMSMFVVAEEPLCAPSVKSHCQYRSWDVRALLGVSAERDFVLKHTKEIGKAIQVVRCFLRRAPCCAPSDARDLLPPFRPRVPQVCSNIPLHCIIQGVCVCHRW